MELYLHLIVLTEIQETWLVVRRSWPQRLQFIRLGKSNRRVGILQEVSLTQSRCKVIVSCCCGQIGLTIALRVLLIRRNKKRDATGFSANFSIADEEVLKDLTDFQVYQGVSYFLVIRLTGLIESSFSILSIGT